MADLTHESGKKDQAGTNSSNGATAGEKHRTEHEAASPHAKKPKTEKQITLEDTINKSTENDDNHKQSNDKSDPSNGGDEGATTSHNQQKTKQSTLEEAVGQEETNKDSNPSQDEDQKDQSTAATGQGQTAEEPGKETQVPHSILEKGIVYFFIRGRVGITEPSDVDDVARSYIMLRPVAKDAQLSKGPIGDAGNTRLLALPKKVLPASGKDRFMVFVEKSGASFDEIKKDFLSSSDYVTKTAGARHTPAAAPVGEGVYAITQTRRETHLVYMLTLPDKMGSAQEELGLKDKGSFILSTKNPEYPGPANAQLPQGPGFSKEILEEFRSLRWMATKPAHLDYVNAQVLLVGESSGIEKAVQPQEEDKEEGNEEPMEALEHLEEEDAKRMEEMPGSQSASIFADLQAQAKDFPKLQTTF